MSTSIIESTPNLIQKVPSKKILGPYLGGLIEGDGSIIYCSTTRFNRS